MTTLNNDHEYVVRVSVARMSSAYWGRYVHVGVVLTRRGRRVVSLRNTRDQEVVEVWRNQFRGKTGRCAAAAALQAARDLAEQLNARSCEDRLDRQQREADVALSSREDVI
jgi:hypothetical protein